MPKERGRDALAENRKALFDYHIEDRVEAGVALTGTEIKSVRAGRLNLREGYARIERGEAWLHGVHIAPWSHGGRDNHDPLRKRKLLLHRAEIVLLGSRVAQKGLTLVPLRVYLKDGRAKIELGLARGKRKYDKRAAIREREIDRETQAALRARARA
jgi:SsrA-binding protein